ncbi:hypothetical protein [Methanobacterium ferruginis]|uniref:hypothetical protein n=1 Tax=Methanobacterium ferruginis TaxID=710191 RepID=UPI0025725EF8|nr:hypothetical protein [Methanobacterium ferruginis]BDZ69417.1 hypothetical protein GCM10025860_28650 [Methanobacterium ferruginis]
MHTNVNVPAIKKKFVLFPLLILFLIIFLFTLNTSSAETTIYVNGTSGNDSWDGTNPTYIGDFVGPKKPLTMLLKL